MLKSVSEKQQTAIERMVEYSLIEVNSNGALMVADEEKDTLIQMRGIMMAASQMKIQKELEEEMIDPIGELIKNNNILPILAIIQKVDLTTIVEGKPLLSLLCTKHIPLASHLNPSKIKFKSDADNRTALHYAIQADDVVSANWCLQNKIDNVRDNFGNTAILDAIRLGRKRCFLLCLHYQFYDEEAPHACAQYNRTWEMKILRSLGYDIVASRDSQHATTMEKAVKHYSFQVVEYLTQVNPNVQVNELSSKTDSKAIIRRILKTKNELSTLKQRWLQLLYIIANISTMLTAILFVPAYQQSQPVLLQFIYLLIVCYAGYVFVPFVVGDQDKLRSNLMTLLQAPQFPVLEDICAPCLRFQEYGKQHCFKCGKCVDKFHFHTIVCVNKNNQIFWFASQVIWLFLLYHLNAILVSHLQFNHLIIANFSSSAFFQFAISLEKLYEQSYMILLLFIYLKIFLLYQFCCIFQLIVMLVLNRTYREVNHTEKYKHLYRIVQTPDLNYKNQEIRLLEKGLIGGMSTAFKNVGLYFFR